MASRSIIDHVRLVFVVTVLAMLAACSGFTWEPAPSRWVTTYDANGNVVSRTLVWR